MSPRMIAAAVPIASKLETILGILNIVGQVLIALSGRPPASLPPQLGHIKNPGVNLDVSQLPTDK